MNLTDVIAAIDTTSGSTLQQPFKTWSHPDTPKRSHIAPIYEGGVQGILENYQPVALTSHL